MGQITSSEIISTLPKLTSDEINQIKETANFLSSNTRKSSIDKHEWLYDALLSELKVHGVLRYITFVSFSETSSYTSFKRGAKEVEQFFNSVFPNHKKRIQKNGISRILIASLIRDMRRRQIPITLGTVSKNVHRLPEVFEISFPNYIQSGLAHLIPTQMERLANGRSG